MRLCNGAATRSHTGSEQVSITARVFAFTALQTDALAALRCRFFQLPIRWGSSGVSVDVVARRLRGLLILLFRRIATVCHAFVKVVADVLIRSILESRCRIPGDPWRIGLSDE